MTERDLMAGGRCLDKPWRIGIAGVSGDDPARPFVLSDAAWHDFIDQLPWQQLKAYADANGLIFEPILDGEHVDHDALLLLLNDKPGQLLSGVSSEIRRYLLLRGSQARLAADHEASFSRIFLPLGEPFTDGQLVSLNQPLTVPATPVSRQEWLLCDDAPELPGLLPQQWCACLESGRVPVHLGNWSVPDWLPQGSYIAAHDLDGQPTLQDYCNARVQASAEKLHAFLTSKDSYPYSSDCWITALTAAIAGDAALVRNTRPLLSVIIPAYNYGRFLKQTISSVLDQGYADIEILVLDNASTDHTAEVLRAFSKESRVRYIRNSRNVGPSYNVLNGIQIAQGQYLSILMADDYYNPGYLSGLLPRLLENPDVVVGYTAIRWVNEQGEVLKMPRHPGYQKQDYVGGRNEVAELLIHDNYIPPSAALIQREPFLQVWRRDPALNGAGDWLSMLQVAEKHPDFIFLSEPGVTYRAHSAQLSTEFYSSNAPLADHIRLVEGVFERAAESKLRGRELGVAAHLRRRLALYPAEQSSALGLRVAELCKQLEALAACDDEVLFSVILTTYNRPAMLLDALRSLAAQSLKDFEVILVNDHGDRVEAALDEFSFPLTYVYKGRNQGLSAARNTGLALARGRYVCYLDDDDMYLPDHLAVLAKAFETQPGAVIYTGVEYVTEEVKDSERRVLKRSEPFRHERFDKERLFIHNYIPVNTWAHPRELIQDAGEFDTGLTAFEDWDMLLRLAALRPLLHVPQVTAQVRTREGDGSEDDHMLGREREKFAALYQEMYRRHSDLGSERVRQGRSVQLQSLGVVAKGDPTPVRTWLAARKLTPVQQRLVNAYVHQQESVAAQLMVVIVDLESDLPAVTSSLDSLQLEKPLSNISSLVLSAASAPNGYKGPWHQVDERAWVTELNSVLTSVSADWVMLLKAGDEFASSGLQMVSLELQANPDCRAIYADGLYRQDASDYGLALRPDFNLDYLLSFPQGMSRHWLFNRENLLSLGGFDAQTGEAMELDLILRLVNQHGLTGLGHVPEPLVLSQALVLRDSELERWVIKTHLAGRGYPEASVDSVLPGQYQIDYGHADRPLVSIVVLVSDELAAAQRCVMSVLENTAYERYEILLIDNASREAATLEWLNALEQMGTALVKVLRSGERLSQSDANNQAALNASGDYLFLLAPDVAVINDSWLDELMNHAQRPEVGIVGACTVNADGKITHAGQVLGLEGPAGEVFLGESLGAPGYMQRLQVDRNVSAVSGNCLLIRKSLYIDLGGMDAATFADQGAALDLCLRVTDGGYMIVWTPRATLLHSAPKPTMSVETEDRLYARWLARLARDPAYNPNFSLAKPGGFKLAAPQISWRPLEVWRPQPVVLAHPADLFGCGHYRVIQPFNALLGAGLVDGALSQGLMHVTDLERYAPDVVVLQRQIGDDRLEAMRRMKAFSSAFKVYELDDYLPNLPMKNAHRHAMPKDIVKSLKRGLSFVDRFVVSTDALAEAFTGFHDDIQVVQNRLDPLWWTNLPLSVRDASTKPRVGWAGGASHTGDLELIFDLVKDLADEVEWVFLGMCPEKLRPYVHEFHEGVSIEQYPRKLASLNLDLALAPVEENLFNECKSNLRLLEYGACAYPVVCSDVRCYAGALPVTRVKNRYRDWVEAVRAHLADPAASAAQGRELYHVVKNDWMLADTGIESWRRAWLP
ncbi:glycosyltransferase [Halopseudomonas sp.]|uniref:glycosyltransferase n=1 Tax=Halopseudomonas sp. TaxID=2901191 RepID=UPI003001BF95